MTSPTTESILLQREFYVPGCITQALADFQAYLSATTTADGEDLLLSLQVAPAHVAEARQIIYEFLNYLLDLSLRVRMEESRRLPPDDHGSPSASSSGTR